MKKNSIKNLVMLCALTLFGFTHAQETVVFNTNNLADGVIEKGAASLNTNWLLDSDIHRPRNVSNEARFAEMEVGSLRYPYGHLADNYLWDTPPFGGTLEPEIGSLDQTPGNFTWATNPDKTMNDIMDFDEFMAICQRQNIKPLVVVNVLSYKYNNGPTYQELKTTAVEWVKYAKQKGYEVAYWQIGNEVDHHQNIMTRAEYVNLYEDFVTDMKAADPTIICGTGILSSTGYFNDLMNRDSNLVDFTSAHQYLFGRPVGNYNEWLNESGTVNYNSNITGMQNAINNSSKPNLPLLVTESNSFGNWDGIYAALYKGLSWFDLLFTQQAIENVAFTYMWNSHSPWLGENVDAGIANALSNDMQNDITAMGMPLKILNTTAEERYMIPDSKVHGRTYSYGSYSPDTGDMTLYLMNKTTSSISMTVNVNNYDPDSSYERWVFTGANQYDNRPTFKQSGSISFTNNGFTTSLPPYSLVAVKLSSSALSTSFPYFIDHVGNGNNGRLRTNDANNDLILSNTSETGWKGKWELVDAGNDYYFIQNQSNGLRLQAITNAIGDQSAVRLINGNYTGDLVQWKLTPVGNNWFIDSKGQNRRLNTGNNGTVTLGQTSWTGTFVQWKLSNASSNSSKSAEGKEALSLNEVKELDLSMYPNPVKGGANITLNYFANEDDEVLDINIINLSGIQVITEKLNTFSGVNKYEVNTKELSPGVYFVELTNNNGNKTIKKILVN